MYSNYENNEQKQKAASIQQIQQKQFTVQGQLDSDKNKSQFTYPINSEQRQDQMKKNSEHFQNTDKKSIMSSSRMSSPCISDVDESNQNGQVKLNKSKPSELPTLSLQINGSKIADLKILTKIHYGKKQFVFELQENDSQPPLTNIQGQNVQNNLTKRKIEIRFKDIEQIDITTIDNQIITIETFHLPKECREHNPQKKKTTQWVEGEFLQTLNYVGGISPQIIKNQKIVFVSSYQPKLLTKSGTQRQSHLDKIKKCCMENNMKLLQDGLLVKYSDQISSIVTPSKMDIQSQKEKLSIDQNSQAYSNQQAPLQQNNYYFPQQSMFMQQQQNDISEIQKVEMMDLSRNNMNNYNMNQSYINQQNYQIPNGQPIVSKNQQVKYNYNAENFGTKSVQKSSSEKNYLIKKSEKMDIEQSSQQLQEMVPEQEELSGGDDERFPALTKEKYQDLKKYDLEIKKMGYDSKLKEMIDILHIKKFPRNYYMGMNRCPYYKCQKHFKNSQMLKSHMQKKHPELQQIGLQVNMSGQFEWQPKAIDFIFLLGKIYPAFLRQIINNMKKERYQDI